MSSKQSSSQRISSKTAHNRARKKKNKHQNRNQSRNQSQNQGTINVHSKSTKKRTPSPKRWVNTNINIARRKRLYRHPANLKLANRLRDIYGRKIRCVS